MADLSVWMGNEDLELVRGPGDCRRRYLDFLGFQLDPAYRRAWSRYRRALKAKNLPLKDGRPRDAEILSYEEILIESGTVLMDSRARMVETLSPLAATAQCQVSGRDEPLTLHYLPGSGPDLRAAILQARERELRQRQAIVGPHRDDLDLRLHGMAAADFASEGQQRTLALALKLAQGTLLEQATGRLPIYLIDDIFGELDPGRRNALMRHLPPAAQKWITTTPSRLAGRYAAARRHGPPPRRQRTGRLWVISELSHWIFPESVFAMAAPPCAASIPPPSNSNSPPDIRFRWKSSGFPRTCCWKTAC